MPASFLEARICWLDAGCTGAERADVSTAYVRAQDF
jgi:hypothetical protein